uniref:uncharacterized protein LOC120348140 isoform X1 n=1 Tax=Styela clava TaxID=7725 RepID=UPI001939F72E|nr:uncharacterized protein LOC120348140 isoform X1 [Styela clava]XP_039274201.1 uncharacterized protein LOC120348140 isoform X2 [Styela clava]
MAANPGTSYPKQFETPAQNSVMPTANVQLQQQAPVGQVMLVQTQSQGAATGKLKPRKKYKNVLFYLGTVEIILAVLCAIFCVVTLILAVRNSSYLYQNFYNDQYYTYRITNGTNAVGHGIWCGAVLLVSGILGIKTKHHTSPCMYRANMTFSILAAIFMLILIVLSIVSIVTVYPRSYSYIVMPFHVILAILGFIGMIISIIHAALCCAGICCRKKPRQINVAYTTQQGQMVQLANGQYVMMPQGCQTSGAMCYAPTTVPVQAGGAPTMQYPQTPIPTQVGGAPTMQYAPPPLPSQAGALPQGQYQHAPMAAQIGIPSASAPMSSLSSVVFPTGQSSQQAVAPYPTMPTQPLITKDQEDQMSSNPPQYTEK